MMLVATLCTGLKEVGENLQGTSWLSVELHVVTALMSKTLMMVLKTYIVDFVHLILY